MTCHTETGRHPLRSPRSHMVSRHSGSPYTGGDEGASDTAKYRVGWKRYTESTPSLRNKMHSAKLQTSQPGPSAVLKSGICGGHLPYPVTEIANLLLEILWVETIESRLFAAVLSVTDISTALGILRPDP